MTAIWIKSQGHFLTFIYILSNNVASFFAILLFDFSLAHTRSNWKHMLKHQVFYFILLHYLFSIQLSFMSFVRHKDISLILLLLPKLPCTYKAEFTYVVSMKKTMYTSKEAFQNCHTHILVYLNTQMGLIQDNKAWYMTKRFPKLESKTEIRMGCF